MAVTMAQTANTTVVSRKPSRGVAHCTSFISRCTSRKNPFKPRFLTFGIAMLPGVGAVVPCFLLSSMFASSLPRKPSSRFKPVGLSGETEEYPIRFRDRVPLGQKIDKSLVLVARKEWLRLEKVDSGPDQIN